MHKNKLVTVDCVESYDALHPTKVPDGWQIQRLFETNFAVPPGGLSRVQARVLHGLVIYGKLKTRQWVELPDAKIVKSKSSFMLMPRHFRDFSLLAYVNNHLIFDSSHGREWSFTWLPAGERLKREATAKQEHLEKLAAEQPEPKVFRHSKLKKRKRYITSGRAKFLATRCWIKAEHATTDVERSKHLRLFRWYMGLRKQRLEQEMSGTSPADTYK